MEEPSCFEALCEKTLKRRNVVTREDALLSTTPPDKDKPRKAASVKAEREDRPERRVP